MNFDMIILNQSTKIKQNYTKWILIALLLMFLLKTFLKTLTMMLKDGLTHLTMMKIIKGYFQLVKKKSSRSFKDGLGGKIMTEFVSLRVKAYAHLKEDGSEHKKVKRIKKCIIKRKLMFENYRDSLFNNKIILKSQKRFKSDHHKVYTEEVNKIVLSSNDDKRLQTFDGITTYPYGANAFKVCESEMMVKKKAIPIKLYYNKI